jgi:hypothetical protein
MQAERIAVTLTPRQLDALIDNAMRTPPARDRDGALRLMALDIQDALRELERARAGR